MLYGGEPPKPVPPPKQCFVQRSRGFKGPEPYTYGFLAKQPGSNYSIRHRDLERTRTERLRTQYEEDFKSFMRHARHTEMIEVADRKCLYNRIKKMVECEMKANEHLFSEACPKPELEVKEEEPPDHQKINEHLEKQAEELKKQKDEEERKLLEEKRLQLFIENSEELRAAAVAKRKKDIAEINYKIIQEKEKIENEQKVKKRELANIENLEIIKMQTQEKELEKRKCIEKKQQFRKELYEQVQEKEENRKKEQENKIVECNDLKKFNQKLLEEEEKEKLERIKKQELRREEIKKFTEERMKLFSNANEAKSTFDDTFAITMRQNLQDDTADVIKEKIQLRNENEMYIKHHAMIKEERKKLSEAMSQMVLKQINEIEEFKHTVERESAEARRKRAEEGNKVLEEQIKSRQLSIEKQKEIKRKLYEQSVREYEEYLNEKKQNCLNKKQYQWQFRKDLNDQIMFRKDIICCIGRKRFPIDHDMTTPTKREVTRILSFFSRAIIRFNLNYY